jgi:hypothetical protein
MIGANAGDRVLLIGRPDPDIVAAVAKTTGLNGQTAVAATAALRPSFEAAAAEEGVLVELIEVAHETHVPAPDAPNDAVVVHVDLHEVPPPSRQTLIEGALGTVRPGGRVIVVEGRRRGALFGRRTPTLPHEAVIALLSASGAVGARLVGQETDIAYFEARKPR